ncbi:MAG TPA: [protein-PII] uridylyltransferase [Pyrinomonadaceae bacterium]|nr:[protein-PII] uridylyltransferase [Pyrinomonadaceae bacterium]
MEIYREKVREHAARRLPLTNPFDPATAAQRLRRFLKLEDERLRMAIRRGATGRWLSKARCFALDVVVQHAFRDAGLPSQNLIALEKAKSTFAVVALGGYGRGELAPFSDLDLLFIHTGIRTTQVQEAVESMLRLLWDSGLTVGHSFRTVRECMFASYLDVHLATALTNTRLLAGSSSVYDCLTAALERDRRKRGSTFIKAVLRERAERYTKFGDVVCLQEPNVKESAGGLRDLHSTFWIAYGKYGCKTVNDLRDRNLISEEEQEITERAYDFLLRVRYQAHLLAGRKIDRLSLDLQPALARAFGYSSDTQLEASEKFMRDYYKCAQDLYLVADAVVVRAAERDKRSSRWRARPRRVSLNELFSIDNGKLQLDGEPGAFAENPLLMFDAFALAQASNVPLGYNLSEAIRNNLHSIDRKFRSSVAASDLFLKLLRRRGRVGHVLRLAHQVGFLGRYLPEFGRISLLIQHDLYHHYTIDEHTLRVVEALDELNNSEDGRRANLRSVFHQVNDPAVLYLSLLLHDIGKGQGPGHVPRGVKIAERICDRLQLSKHDAAKVVSLVAHHITMAHISQRRDLTEPHVASQFATEMETIDQLNMLLLLTYSDMNGVGPGVWSEWKGHLLWDLYERSRSHLVEAETPARGPAQLAELKEKVLSGLDGQFPRSVVERHLALLPDRYLRTTTAAAAAQHLRLIEGLDKDSFRCHWLQHDDTITELTICAGDRHGLFADIAGTLTTQGVEILRAEINTREDGIAIDVFILRMAATHHAIEDNRRLRIEQALRAAIAGKCDVPALVQKWQTQHAPRRRFEPANTRHKKLAHVACDNKAAQAATVVEVRASDEVGLAYKIASVATALGLEITYAKITTEKSDAFDVFYVTDANGIRLSEEAMRELEHAMMEKLSNGKEPRINTNNADQKEKGESAVSLSVS